MKKFWAIRFSVILCVVGGFIPGRLQAVGDSLQVAVVNTLTQVGNLRFVERDATNILLRVMDENGQAFKALNIDQVRITRGAAHAKILKVASLAAVQETNLNVVLTLDNSSSMQMSTRELLQSVKRLLNTLRARSQISLVIFSEMDDLYSKSQNVYRGKKINVSHYPFMTNVDSLFQFIQSRYEASRLSSKTYLYDAILTGLEQFQKLPANLLRVMVLFSDGADLGSTFDFDDALEAARAAGVTIYSIDYSATSQIEPDLKKISLATPQGKIYKAKKATDLLPVFDELSKELITEFQVTYHFPVPPTGSIQFAADTLKVTRRNLVDEFPCLTYLFFDSAAAAIDARYHLFTTPAEAANFDAETITTALDKYYHLLNVIGSRAQKNPQAKLTLTGCNMNLGAEQGNVALAKQRAQVVSQYLQNIWGIAADRIKIVAQNLPAKPSSSKLATGRAENRCVEIFSPDYNIIRPVRSQVTELLYQPEIGYFQTDLQVPEGLKELKFCARAAERELTTLKFDELKTVINWNWIDAAGEKLHALNEMEYLIKITDHEGLFFQSEAKVIPIKEASHSTAIIQATQDTLFEKFSLILFDFNSAELGANNQNLMQRVLDVYQRHPQANFRVLGYSDDIGSEEYNLKLSTARAKIALTTLRRMGIPESALSLRGYGESNPIFSNGMPEGRFLNRTVQILIGYPNTGITNK